MIRRLFIVLSFALLGAMPAIAQGAWEISQFELYDEDKGKTEGAFAWMNEVGLKLEAAGFVQLLIKPLQTEEFMWILEVARNGIAATYPM